MMHWFGTQAGCFWLGAPIVVAALLFPVLIPAIRRHYRETRGPNRCGKCGYNLTGNASGSCPECGTAIEA